MSLWMGVSISLENVPYCVASFAAYLVYLNFRRVSAGSSESGSARAQRENEWVVALHAALESGPREEEYLAASPSALRSRGRCIKR